ncbi:MULTISPECIES: hypothetical protein [Streptomyces]|uniref:DUF2243 domain-containing protein n=1 Tax=Streptomyces demainii TaxID=588122 RepID=A0ABT9KU77_9ACTN|nr:MULTISPECIES: hypothetical protein [Streptomyces]MDP9612003.1 hypothetical protein [Streptomyces demainii]GLV72819.1 hypothetical protein Shyhy02_08220 [Streptomyces hygroscopicus subsp. hygroscopicus]
MTSSTPTSPLAALSHVVSFALVVGGGSGLLHEWWGWLHFMGFVRFLVPDGYEVYGYVVMVVVGAAVGAAGGALDERSRG